MLAQQWACWHQLILHQRTVFQRVNHDRPCAEAVLGLPITAPRYIQCNFTEFCGGALEYAGITEDGLRELRAKATISIDEVQLNIAAVG